MTLNEHERLPIEQLLAECQRKLQQAKTSIHANSARGLITIRKRAIQVDVLRSLLAEGGSKHEEHIRA